MTSNKSKFFPVMVTVIILFIVIFLFANLKQSNVTCTKKSTNDLDIAIVESLDAQLDGSKIGELKLTKTIILPDKYLTDDEKYLEYIQSSIQKSYAYLGKGKVKFSKLTDRLIVYIEVNNGETLILNNITFTDDNDLTIKINPNTKSSEVVTLKVFENYTEGELMTHLKNNGYSCG